MTLRVEFCRDDDDGRWIAEVMGRTGLRHRVMADDCITLDQVERIIYVLLDGASSGAFDRWTTLQVVAGLVRTHIAPFVDIDGGWRAARAYYGTRDRVAAVAQMRTEQ